MFTTPAYPGETTDGIFTWEGKGLGWDPYGHGPDQARVVVPDINLAAGASVAAELYGKACPILAVSEVEFEFLGRQTRLRIAADGAITPA